MTAIDHILAALLALACLSQLFSQIDPDRFTRRQFYLAGALTAVVLAQIPLLFWWIERKSLAGFGLLGWSGAGAAGVVAAVLWAAALLAIVLAIRGGLGRAWLTGTYRDYAWIMPRTRGELAASWVTSLAAGTGEEIAFRGFLLWYAAGLVGLLPGLLLSSLLFGLMHAYQRVRGMAWASVAGLVLGLAYLASESLLLVIWMHASWNMASFAVGRIVLASGTGEARHVPL